MSPTCQAKDRPSLEPHGIERPSRNPPAPVCIGQESSLEGVSIRNRSSSCVPTTWCKWRMLASPGSQVDFLIDLGGSDRITRERSKPSHEQRGFHLWCLSKMINLIKARSTARRPVATKPGDSEKRSSSCSGGMNSRFTCAACPCLLEKVGTSMSGKKKNFTAPWVRLKKRDP